MNKFEKVICNLLITVVALIPFLTVISIYISKISLIKDLIIVLICILLILKLVYKKNLVIDKKIIIILIYVIYGILHFFTKNVSVEIFLDKYRLIYLYPILFLLLYIYILNFERYFIINKFKEYLIKVLYYQIIIVLFGGICELIWGTAFREFIYKDLASTLHVNLMGESGIRILSFMGNPINTSVFLSIGVVVLLFRRQTIINILLLSISNILIILSFSRISYIILVLIYIYYFFINIYKVKKILIFGFFISIMLIGIGNISFIENKALLIEKRIDKISFIDFKENERIINWQNYINKNFDNNTLKILWGGGIGTSNSNSKKIDNINIYKVESSYISILGELGIIGLMMYLIIIISSIKFIFKEKNNQFLMINFIILIAGLTNDMYVNNPFSFYFWAIIFLAYANNLIKVRELKNENSNSRNGLRRII